MTLLLGTVVREAVLFVVPLAYALWAVRPLDRRAALDSLAVAVPAVAAYAAIRLSVSTVGETQVPGYAGSLIAERFTVIKLGLQSAFQEARRMFTVYGPLWLVAPLALRDMRFARRGLVLVALALAVDDVRARLGAHDPARGADLLSRLGIRARRRPSWTRPVLAAFLLLAIGYAVYMDVSGVKSGIIDNPPPPYPVQ